MSVSVNDKIASSIETFAVGDAWGFITEFMKFPQIMKDKPQIPAVLKVSDDTQMGIYSVLAVYQMLKQNVDLSTLDSLETQNAVRKTFADSYINFYNDRDNDRAPGMTCMKALRNYDNSPVKVTGLEGGANYSLGCGTIMRSPWLGLFPYDRKTLTYLAVLQSQTTHGDPQGWVVSAVLTLMINDMLHERIDYTTIESLFEPACKIVKEISGITLHSGQDKLLTAVNDVSEVLESFVANWEPIKKAILYKDGNNRAFDVNEIFGEGWIATESLYNALGVVSAFMEKDQVLQGLEKLVYTNGE